MFTSISWLFMFSRLEICSYLNILVKKCLIFNIISGSFVQEPGKCFESVWILLSRTLIVNFSVTFSQDLLTRHKALVAEYLEQNYDAVSDWSDRHRFQRCGSTPQRICLENTQQMLYSYHTCKVLVFHVILNQRHHVELASCPPSSVPWPQLSRSSRSISPPSAIWKRKHKHCPRPQERQHTQIQTDLVSVTSVLNGPVTYPRKDLSHWTHFGQEAKKEKFDQ